MKVLLVDGDLDALDITAYMLRRERFAVVEASDGAQALRLFKLERPHLVVVNLALPALGGVEVLRQIRVGDRTPVLVVTGRNDTQDIVRCYELGADDFITQPYAFGELALRIRAMLKRAGDSVREEPEAPLQLGDLRLDPETNEVTRGSSSIRLTPTEFRIFYTLTKSAERVVPASRLLTYVWGNRGGATNSLRSHICHLRKKLTLDGISHGSIESVPGVGYAFRTSTVRKTSLHDEPVVVGQVVART
jgi:two-component system, OmpR family, response regulator MprA